MYVYRVGVHDAVLHMETRDDLSDKKPEGGKRKSQCISGGRRIHGERTASAKALRLGCTWRVLGIVSHCGRSRVSEGERERGREG